MTDWDPDRYLQFADERGRPFADLLTRVRAEPRTVVDLGCGPGQLTTTLLDRWPTANVVGIDASAAMIAHARSLPARTGLSFQQADLRSWRPDSPVDVVVSNATLQWVPEHRTILPRLVDSLAPGGWLAFQVPGNFGEASHRLLAELAADPRFAPWTAGVERPAAADPATYLDDLAALGCRVDAWETTYLHVLTGPDPVFSWISGTGARPVLQALPDHRRPEFVTRYQAALAEAYPSRPYGTVLPFRRVFVVAQRN